MLSKLVAFLTSRWFISLIGTIALALLVWFLGPLFAFADARPLESETARLIVVFLLLLVWALWMQWSLVRHRAANVKMVEALGAPAAAAANRPDPDREASDEELGLLRENLTGALAGLKRARFKGRWGNRYLYEMPWFLMVGAPGSGKTTALLNSGLTFPLSATLGSKPLRDLGGTRNCDWWFTEEAVLIDTAGRYTTQDSRRQVDSQVWLGFLDLLKRHRPRQPINGALMAVSLPDLLVWSDAERAEHAHTLRQRLSELREQLGVRFPVYVLLTKADLLAGFTEFFEDLTKDEREQVWGITFPLELGARGGGDAAAAEPAYLAFPAGYDALVDRIDRRVADRMQVEPDITRRGMNFGFPTQLAALKPALMDLLEIVFAPSRYEEPALPRGVYLTSGAQDGAPRDALEGPFARAFALDQPPLPFLPEGRRAFFLGRLMREVVFQEANLVGIDLGRERRQRRLLLATTGGVAAAAAALTGFWLLSAANNRALQDEITAATAMAKEALKPLETAPASLTRVNDTDFARIIPFLNALRAIPTGWDERDQDPSFTLTGGLYQGNRLGREARSVYLTALRTVLLSRVFLRLEEQVRRERSRHDYLREALKVYLMLGGKGPLDKELVVRWMALDWLTSYPGDLNADNRASLEKHLTSLVDRGFSPVAVDDTLVAEARAVLLQDSQAALGYQWLRRMPVDGGQPAVEGLPPWRLVEKAGPLSSRVLLRPSGAPLSDGVTGFFTYDGFHGTVLPAIPKAAQAIADDAWVLGQEVTGPAGIKQTQKWEKEILDLYLNDYGREWDKLLADVAIVPFRSVSHAADVLNALSGPQSPLKMMLVAATRETTLVPAPGQQAGGTTPPPTGSASGPGANTVNALANAQRNAALGQSNLSSLAKLAGVNLTAGPPPGQQINDRFKPLHDYVKGDPSQLDEAIKKLGDLYKQVSAAANAPDQNAALLAGLSGGAGGGQLVTQLKAAAGDMPPPLGGVVAEVAANAGGIAVGGARAQMNQAWKANVLPLCQAALTDRFPMVPTSNVDVAPADFAKLFAPGGLIDQFFNTNLKPFVNTVVKPWAWQKADGVDLGIPQEVLAQFERAAAIRDGLFPAGAATPKVVFELTPLTLDARATQAILDIDGQSLSYRHGPPLPMIMRWPGGDGPSSVRLSFGPPLPGQPAALVKNGTWSLFRFLASGTLKRTEQPELFQFDIAVGNRNAGYTLRADSVNNPFGQNLMEAFRCPASL